MMMHHHLTASFYHVIWKTIDSINACEQLKFHFPQTITECRTAATGFASISTANAIKNC